MTVATRALFSGALAASPIPTQALTSAPNGGNSPWTVPGAIHAEGKTHIGYVDGSGNIEAITVDDDGTVSGPYTIDASFEVDAHSSPVLLRRASDGRLITVYSKHNSTPINLRVSTNPDDASAWGAATNLDSQLEATRYTDYQLWEYDGTLYLFYRDEPSAGTDSRWCLSTCDAASPTSGWATQTIVFRIASNRSYVVSRLDPATGRLHFAATNGSATSYTAIGHFYYDTTAGTYHRSDGTDITSDLALDFTEVTTAYSGTYKVYPANIAVDENGHPVIAVWDTIATEQRYIYVRWNGSTWGSTNVASAADGYKYGDATEAIDYNAYGSCIDLLDADAMWVIEEVAGQTEVALYRTQDGGSSFTRRAVTSDGSGLKVQLIPVATPHRRLRCFWHEGTWTHYTNYSVGLRGAGI